MVKAYINGMLVTIYGYRPGEAKCYVPEVGITSWYNLNLIELRNEDM